MEHQQFNHHSTCNGGYHLDETLNRIVQISATNIKNYCEGKEIINKVNLEV